MAVRVGDSRPIRGFIRELILVSIFWLNSCRIDESAKRLLSSFVSSTGFRFCTLLFEIKYFFTPSPYFSTMAPFFPQSKRISIPTTKAAAQKGKNSKGKEKESGPEAADEVKLEYCNFSLGEDHQY